MHVRRKGSEKVRRSPDREKCAARRRAKPARLVGDHDGRLALGHRDALSALLAAEAADERENEADAVVSVVDQEPRAGDAVRCALDDRHADPAKGLGAHPEPEGCVPRYLQFDLEGLPAIFLAGESRRSRSVSAALSKTTGR